MRERVGFSDNGEGLRKTIEMWYKPLKAKHTSLPWDAIVFRCGTMVRLDCTETHHRPIESFVDDLDLNEFLRRDWPDHRFVDKTYDEWKAENQVDFEWSQKTAYPAQCRKAYGCLMWSSYPLPGGMGGDRTVFPWNVDKQDFSWVYQTVFEHLGFCCWTPYLVTDHPKEITSLFPEADPSEQDGEFLRHHCMMRHQSVITSVDKETAELRRLDYMFPKPYAYVDKEMNIHVL